MYLKKVKEATYYGDIQNSAITIQLTVNAISDKFLTKITIFFTKTKSNIHTTNVLAATQYSYVFAANEKPTCNRYFKLEIYIQTD